MLLSKNTIKKNICAVGGRSGGHIIPCISYITEKKNANASIDKTILFYSSTDLTTSLVKRSPIINCPIPITAEPIPYTKWYLFPIWCVKLCFAFFRSFFTLLKLKPAEVMSSGGIESIPVCLAARILRIPIVVLELNVIPGNAVLFLSRFVPEISICFKETARYFPHNKTLLTHYPIRFSSEEIKTPTKNALSYYSLSLYKKTIVVLGGSQGSFSLNRIAAETIIELSHHYKNIQVIHQIGNDDFGIYKQLYLNAGIEGTVITFEQHAYYLYSAADVIIARAGAGTLFEIAAFSKNACIIPLETMTTDHQKDNAQAFVHTNPDRFVMFLQKELIQNKNPLINTLIRMLKIDDQCIEV
jgi:UDP-N-acetylglucosamine--N-acetylmuramyl-(pentapeptide) pyrophosphoryl-undecaprenol N-acetylglucosamine transferase